MKSSKIVHKHLESDEEEEESIEDKKSRVKKDKTKRKSIYLKKN